MSWYAAYDAAQAAYDRSPTDANRSRLDAAVVDMHVRKRVHDAAARLESDLARAALHRNR